MPADSIGDGEEKEYKKELLNRYKAIQQEQQIRSYLHQIVDPSAYERLMNIRASNKELYMQIAQVLINIVQSNKSMQKITEKQLVDLINRMTQRRETKIEFKHK